MNDTGGDNDRIIAFSGALPLDREPILNLPTVTACLAALFILVHGTIAVFATEPQVYDIYERFGFTPAAFSDPDASRGRLCLSLFTHMALHGGTGHLAINTLSVMAFGAGVERRSDGPRFLAFFILCGLAAALTHFVLNAGSSDPVIGMSEWTTRPTTADGGGVPGNPVTST